MLAAGEAAERYEEEYWPFVKRCGAGLGLCATQQDCAGSAGQCGKVAHAGYPRQGR